MTFLHTFRGRLLLILALLLVTTLGFQYYLNLLVQNENNEIREKQEQSLDAGFAIGMSGLTSTERIQDLVKAPGQTFFDEQARERIKEILIIDDQWQVWDGLTNEHLPTTGSGGEIIYKHLKDIQDLPAPSGAPRLGADLKQFPNAAPDDTKGQDEVHAVPVQTSEGRWYVIVILKSDRGAAALRAAQPLTYTLGVLLASSLITLLLVWRFTRPVADLSRAARELAEGNLQVRVQDFMRTDEMGRLGKNFNEMAAELEKKSELEAQLQQAEKSAVVGRLGSAIAHEIRNPLNYINLTLDHLRSKFAPADPEKRETFEKLTFQLKTEVARINQQISDFLNYSRPTKADLKPIAARKAIQESLRIIEPQAAEKHVTVSVVEHEDVPQIMGDPEFLRSVFNNLFINAIQSMEEGGGNLDIKITPGDSGKCVSFEVSDTGNGIPPENLENIFEPYFSTKETGTGLGLAIVQKIIDIHNGKIDVESTEGEGTKFTVRLPKAN
ncbi:MAG: ATP-binding protein [Pyrinomonadaceae bacterium]